MPDSRIEAGATCVAEVEEGSTELAMPPKLDSGQYGVAGRARDADCVWYAWGCNLVNLPVRSGLNNPSRGG